MSEHTDPLDVLLELTRALSVGRSLRTALQLVADAALKLIRADHASVRVLDHTRTDLLSSARAGTGALAKPASFRPGVGVAGWVVEEGQVARIGDVTKDARFVDRPDQGFDIRSILAVPLWSAGEVVGVLAVTSPEPSAFDDRDESLGCLLANCVVPPIERARLARLAVTDPQTMAFVRGYLVPGLQHEMQDVAQASKPLSVLLMNLDQFKRINDVHGGAAGDEVLREFANRIRSWTRDQDVLVRRSGDEFVLIMSGADQHEARAVAERIRSAMATTEIDLGDGRRVTQTVSIGGASWNSHEGPEALEKRAAEAAFSAKLHGGNRVHFDDGQG